MRLNNSESVQKSEMMALQMTPLNVTGKRNKSTIHTNSLEEVQIQSNKKLVTHTMARTIKNVTLRMLHRPTINWIPTHTGLHGNKIAYQLQREAWNLKELTWVLISTFRGQHTVSDGDKYKSGYTKKTYWSMWIVRMSPTYSQLTTGRPLRGKWGEEETTTDYWICIIQLWNTGTVWGNTIKWLRNYDNNNQITKGSIL